MRKRWIGIFGSLVLAAGGTIILVQYVNGADTRALAGQEVTEVLMVTEQVAAGSSVEEVAAGVEIEMIPTKMVAPDSLSTLRNLGGQVTAVDLMPGEQVLSTRFITPAELEAENTATIPTGLVEVTVALAPERAVGAALRIGDLVTVFASFDLDTATPSTTGEEPDPEKTDDPGTPSASGVLSTMPSSTALILHNTLVTNVQVDTDGAAVTPDPAEGEDDLARPAPQGDVLVTLAVTPADAERIVFTAEFGGVWLGHEATGVTDERSSLQTRAGIYDRPAQGVGP